MKGLVLFMSVIEIICGALIIVASIIVMICSVLIEPASSGLGTLAGGDSNYFGKNASRTKQAMVKRATWFMGAIIVVCTLVILFYTK